MALDTALLRSSFAFVVERQPAVTQRFYEILFERYPQARALFGRHTQRAQEEMLQGALVAVLDHLEDAAWLQQTLSGLGAKHVDYGVTAEMYSWVGESLLATLAEIAAEAWTPELERAWAEAYGTIVELMLAGAGPTSEETPKARSA